MPEWLIEHGIGEVRSVLVEDGNIIEARVELDGTIASGSVLGAQLIDIGVHGRNALARDDDGTEYLLPRGAGRATQGERLDIEVTRSLIPGSEPWKRPLARLAGGDLHRQSPMAGRNVAFPAPRDELGEVGWNDLLEEARSGFVGFDGGELRIVATPAMTLIDVDGDLAPDELAAIGAGRSASAIRRLDIGGSIGIDLPTVGNKSARQAAAASIDDLLPQPFERTAVNGFGFVQIVRPRSRASLIELAQDRAAFEARVLLRNAAFEKAGPKRLVAHPAVAAVLERERSWLDQLARQVGGPVSLRADPVLPMSGGYAESV